MLYIVILFLALSLVMYCLFGGADFGAGIVELITKEKYYKDGKKVVTRAIAPVWEANHMWLIIMVVILFNGFPIIYTTVSTALHIPLCIMLVGIILRGTAFTFRHYDAIEDESQKYYNYIFAFSSLLSSLFLGILVGAVSLGRIQRNPINFYEGFIAPWYNAFSFAVGVFTCCVFAYLAAIYLIGECRTQRMRKVFTKQAMYLSIAAIISGLLVFAAATYNGFPLFTQFITSNLSVAAAILATGSLGVLWYALQKEQIIIPRLAAGFQVCMILVAWMGIQYPVVVKIQNAEDLTFFNANAPDITLFYLGWALLIGSVFILPFLAYLMKVFKWDKEEMDVRK